MKKIRFTDPWIVGVQGLILIILGMAALVNPEVTLITITRFFGIILLLSGLFLVISAKNKLKEYSEFWFYEGIVNIIVGFIFLVFPTLVTNIFVIVLGIAALIVGVRNLWITIRNKTRFLVVKVVRNIVLVIFGLLFVFVPFESAKLIINITGFVALLYGFLTMFIAYKYYHLNDVEE